MRKLLVMIITVGVLIASMKTYAQSNEENEMAKEEAKILEVIKTYEQAFADADADGLADLHWLEDERFSEIEDMIPMPFGKKTYEKIADWIRKNAEPGTRQMKFHDPNVFFLAEDVAYLVAIQEIKTPKGETKSRVTLIFLKKDGQWKIIHGHFSEMPEV